MADRVATRVDIARVAALGAVTVAALPILLFRRSEIATELSLVGAVVWEVAVFGAVACSVAAVVPRATRRVRSSVLIVVGGALAALGTLLLGLADDVGLFWVAGLLLAVGAGLGAPLHRVLLTEHRVLPSPFRTMAWYWAAVATGATASFVPLFWDPVSYTTIATWIGVGALVCAAVASPLARLGDPSGPAAGSRIPTTPWGRRSVGAAFAGGVAVIGAADAARDIVFGDWQRSVAGGAALLAAGPAAAALISWFGPWYHRLDRLEEGRRADAAGTQLVVGGVLIVAGAASITYVGLAFSWIVAGGALALAATTLDASVFGSFTPELRRVVASRQFVALGVGGALTMILFGGPLSSLDERWQVAIAAVPLVVVGWRTRRGAPSARDRDTSADSSRSTGVPRRVYDESEGRVPLLSVESLDVSYGPVQVLFGVDLRIDDGQVVALLGTNGAGKTTLLRAISGLEPAAAGRVVYAGVDVTRTRPTWRVGMGLQQVVGGNAVAPSLTVDENLRLFAFTVDDDSAAERTDEALALFPRLRERHDQLAGTLSGGEKQMLGLSKALITRPSLLMVDEFSLGLAPTVIADLLPVVRRIADRGAAVLLVEQSANIALSVADHAYVMEKGEIRFDGATDELRDRPDLLRAAYLEGLAKALED